jgi:hypothetical protein
MISTRDPETMTADERRLKVASILVASLLRRDSAADYMKRRNGYGLELNDPILFRAKTLA